jgi:HSP20 family protein
MPGKTDQYVTPREEQRMARREPLRAGGPFRMLERFADDIDRVFEDFGFGRWQNRDWASMARSGSGMWAPEVEVFQRDHDLVVHADLPGMKKDDVHIDVTDNNITISGERRQEWETEREGVYRTERSYGSFCRTIPLPEGAITDQAKATFKDGVLEITIPAPPEQVTRARRLEIKEGTEAKK